MQGKRAAENTMRGGVADMPGNGATEDTKCSSPFLSKGGAAKDDSMDDSTDNG
jgi:hypothetical protein